MTLDTRSVTRARTVRPADFGELEELIYESTDAYAHPVDPASRVEWIASAAEHHLATNTVFGRLANHAHFSPDELRATGDLATVPLLSSGLFKRRDVTSAVEGTLRLCKSSGTRGAQSVVPRDRVTLERFVGTVLHGMREFLGDSELREVLVLGPPPAEAGELWFSYVLTLVELLHDTSFLVRDGQLEADAAYRRLEAFEPGAEPTIVAPPALLFDFLGWMEARDLTLDLSGRNAYVVTAGGWKRRHDESVDRDELTATIVARLGVEPGHVRDVFNMVELNTVLFECELGHKHVPPWLVALARRPSDLGVAEPGEEGLLSFLDPTATSYPSFILSDDFGVVEHERCDCGRHGQTVAINRRLAAIEERGCGLKMARYGTAG